MGQCGVVLLHPQEMLYKNNLDGQPCAKMEYPLVHPCTDPFWLVNFGTDSQRFPSYFPVLLYSMYYPTYFKRSMTAASCNSSLLLRNCRSYHENAWAKSSALQQTSRPSFRVLNTMGTETSNELCHLKPNFGGGKATFKRAEAPFPFLGGPEKICLPMHLLAKYCLQRKQARVALSENQWSAS